jgi:hypothetical protein
MVTSVKSTVEPEEQSTGKSGEWDKPVAARRLGSVSSRQAGAGSGGDVSNRARAAAVRGSELQWLAPAEGKQRRRRAQPTSHVSPREEKKRLTLWSRMSGSSTHLTYVSNQTGN